jgi:glutamate-1-semialdehyde 2,1-aminomutase
MTTQTAIQSQHAATHRYVPTTSTPISPEKVAALLAAEWKLFTKNTGASEVESKRAFNTMPLGVTSSFQHWDPYPISIVSAKGAYMTDVDGRQLLDLSMGFGAMLAGHLNPIVVEEIQASLNQ